MTVLQAAYFLNTPPTGVLHLSRGSKAAGSWSSELAQLVTEVRDTLRQLCRGSATASWSDRVLPLPPSPDAAPNCRERSGDAR